LIDLHSHILPGVDDGAPDISVTLEMAKMAVADGVEVMACTPHFMPGVFENDAQDVRRRVAELNDHLLEHDIDLALVVGSDAHIRPDFVSCLVEGRILCLHDTRYVLVEPPHAILPPRLDELLFNILAAGYVPILTHPERLSWIDQSPGLMAHYTRMGVWLQVTAGSLFGEFGRKAQYWAQKLLSDGMVHILASDAHDTAKRPPGLSRAFEYALREVGLDEATQLVLSRAEKILDNSSVEAVAPVRAKMSNLTGSKPLWRRLFQGSPA